MKEHKITYIIRRNGYSIFILINIEKIIIDRKVIIIALVIDAEIIDKVTSAEDKGAPIKSTILPITLPIKIDDEELALEAVREVGHDGHFFGCSHTQDRYKSAYYSPLLSDWSNL